MASSVDPNEQCIPGLVTRWAVACAVTVHLAIVVASASHYSVTDLLSHHSISQALDYYGFVSGSSNHFGFFAPGVVSQFRVVYKLKDREGTIFKERNLNSGNIETSFRFHNMIENFWLKENEAPLRRALTASWAAKLFSTHSEAKNIEILVEAYVIPGMAQYRSGERPHWIKHYSANYTRGT